MAERGIEHITILRLQNPEAVFFPVIQELFHRAFAKANFGNAYDALLWVSENATNEKVHIALSRNDLGYFNGMSISSSETNVFSEFPFVLYFYSEGGEKVKYALQDEIDAWVTESGYDRFRCFNTSGKTDEWYFERFSPEGRGKVICSLIEFTVPQEE